MRRQCQFFDNRYIQRSWALHDLSMIWELWQIPIPTARYHFSCHFTDDSILLLWSSTLYKVLSMTYRGRLVYHDPCLLSLLVSTMKTVMPPHSLQINAVMGIPVVTFIRSTMFISTSIFLGLTPVRWARCNWFLFCSENPLASHPSTWGAYTSYQKELG